jgi:aconitate hydratase
LPTGHRTIDIGAATERHGVDIATLPYVIRVMVENLERHLPGGGAGEDDVAAAVHWKENAGRGIPLHASRVILPDSSGLPVLQGLATLRDAAARTGADPLVVEPRVPTHIIVDHSLQVDRFGVPAAEFLNLEHEFRRNGERYRFLKWAQQAFHRIGVFPPGAGIIHHLNLETISKVVETAVVDGERFAFPEFVLGGDSHTPMMNALGVLGWGIGGLDAEAAMLGYPHIFPIPEIIGVRLVGRVPVGCTTTDVVLSVTQRLRAVGVIAAIVEFTGDGARLLTVPERATLSNMAPEYGATAAFFPVDAQTIRYLSVTRSPAHAAFVEDYCRRNSLYREPGCEEPLYARVIEIDLATIRRSVAGPFRPQDRLDLADIAQDFRARLPRALTEGGFATGDVGTGGRRTALRHGSLAIAAITACTNTSNPSVMIAAGLLARKATELGLRVPRHVKTSLAPGSRDVTRYLADLGLLSHLETLGFHVVGYGCTTCGGKSGPLVPEMAEAVEAAGIVAAAALSGNRNFEGRIHRQVRANYIMSPPLVVAFALAGRIDIDLETEPLGFTPQGSPVMLGDIWPADAEIANLVLRAAVGQGTGDARGQPAGNALWEKLEAPEGPLFQWEAGSTYLLPSPFLDLARAAGLDEVADTIGNAPALGAYGDSLTTDHISPGGEIPADSSAGRYLRGLGVERTAFNTYVSRRCNHEVMARATFANVRIKNLLVPQREGGYTRLLPDGRIAEIYEAACAYRDSGVPVVILGGKEYGAGSSRDWAAKGSALLGVKAVLAESFERIHRSNLVSMGILPLRFLSGEGWRQLGMTGSETLTISGIRRAIAEGVPVAVRAVAGNREISFRATLDVSTHSERNLLACGGLLAQVFRDIVSEPRGRRTAAVEEGSR